MPNIKIYPFERPYFPRSALKGSNLEFWVGRTELINRIVRGLLSSEECRYLITGYPGVGKSSFVSRVINDWRQLSPISGVNRVLIFNLRLGQQSATDVINKLIGKVYFGSLDGQFIPSKQLQEKLQLNFIQAYSKSLKQTQSEKNLQDSGSEFGAKFPEATMIPGDFKVTSKKSSESNKSLEIQSEYNFNAVVSDFEDVVHLLTKPESNNSRWRRFTDFIFNSRPENGSTRVLFVLDQIDTLENLQELSSLFNLPNASFIVIGGIKLKEQILINKEKGENILDNFQEEYLQCEWNKADQILEKLVSPNSMGRFFNDYRDYLNFFSHGMPRKLFSAIDQHTNIFEDNFSLCLHHSDINLVKLCAKLHRIIWKNRKRILGQYIDSVQHFYRDKALRGAYHLTDNIFRSPKFSYHQANTVATQLSELMIHQERERVLKNLLSLFVEENLLRQQDSEYYLTDSILNLLKTVPNWLKDGYVDAKTFLQDLTMTNIPKIQSPFGNDFQHPTLSPPNFPETFGYPTNSDWQSSPQIINIPETVVFNVDQNKLLSITPDVILGRYKEIEKIGSGGFSEVILATDLRLNRQVALKILKAQISENSRVFERLTKEATLIASLNHPNIIQVFDFGISEQNQFILVTEYLDGNTLEELLREKKPLRFELTVKIALNVAEALQVAHEKQIIHRDVKPSNIMIKKETGWATLFDFGIAKDMSDTTVSSTQTFELIGTPEIMSPEQISNSTIDLRSDLYSLGAVIYSMITGQSYIEANSIAEFFYKIMQEEVKPPSQINPKIPIELENIVLKLLKKDPNERYQTASDLIVDLKNVEIII